MASKIDATYFRVRGVQESYRRRERGTTSWLQARINDRCYVSFSAGKDSMVVASLCVRVRPDIPIAMVDPGVPVHWTDEDRAKIIEFTTAARWNLSLFPWEKFTNAQGLAAQSEREYRDGVHEGQFAKLFAFGGSR